MYNQRILEEMQDEIETQIRAMPNNYTSIEFYTSLELAYPRKYENLVRVYMERGHDRPHSIQILNSQLMHTVNNQFGHLTRKVATIANPKGGDMSRWVRV